MADATRRTYKIRFAVYSHNMGDGSVSPRFYTTRDLADQAAAQNNERMCEDVVMREIEIDCETGEIVSGVRTLVDPPEEF